MADYAKDVLVETDWVQEHLEDDSIRIVEVDENPALYEEAHIPGAIGFDWKKDLQDQVKRDFLGPQEFGELMGGRGITNDHQIVLYGDRNNWFAAYTYWYLKYYGHDNVKLLNGPRERWINEGRPTTTETPNYPEATFEAERRGMPILAICRGAQVLNVAHGGDLLQHLPDDVGEEVRHVRADPVGRVPEHEVEIEPDSLLARVTGRERMTVNSSHHQAPNRIGAGLRVVARAADGVVEGLERPDRDFVLGVQWHAEAIANRVEQAALFSTFVDASRRYAASTSSTARTAPASQPA